jgi:integrase
MDNAPVTASVFSVRDTHGLLIPVLMADGPDGTPAVVPEAVEFLRRLAVEGESLARMRSAATVLALLHDHLSFFCPGRVFTEGELPEAVASFLRDRRQGVTSEDGLLRWTPVRFETVKRDRHFLRMFSDFCAKSYGYFPLVPSSRRHPFPLNGADHGTLIHRLSRSRHGLLGHLAARGGYAPTTSVGIREKSPGRISTRRSFLSKSAVIDLIESTRSPVQRLVFIQAAFGGQRISEILHTWRCDVLPGRQRPLLFSDDTASEVPLVLIAHPSQARYTGTGDFTRDRLRHLSETYGLLPRNLVEGTPEHAGWKDIAYDNQSLLISQVFWSDRAWAGIFMDLFRKIRDEILPLAGPDVASSHPYLVVNDHHGRPGFGRPMKMPNILKAFRRAAAKLSIDESRHMGGIHGLRHFYKATLEEAGLSPDQIRMAMHHRSVTSQSSYGKSSALLNARLDLLGKGGTL